MLKDAHAVVSWQRNTQVLTVLDRPFFRLISTFTSLLRFFRALHLLVTQIDPQRSFE